MKKIGLLILSFSLFITNCKGMNSDDSWIYDVADKSVPLVQNIDIESGADDQRREPIENNREVYQQIFTKVLIMSMGVITVGAGEFCIEHSVNNVITEMRAMQCCGVLLFIYGLLFGVLD